MKGEYHEIKPEQIRKFLEREFLVKEKLMVKADLKTGDIVKLRSGDICICLGDTITWPNRCTSFKLSRYTDDLKHCEASKYDIMYVRHQPPISLRDLESVFSGMRHLCWDWEREEVKEVTMAEIEEKFGCKVKIVKERSEDDYDYRFDRMHVTDVNGRTWIF